MVPRPQSGDGSEDAFHQARQRAARDPLLSSAKDGQCAAPVSVKQILDSAAQPSARESASKSISEAASGLLVGRLVTRHVPPRLWSTFIEDETGGIRACILEPNISHLGELIATTSWRLVVAPKPPQAHKAVSGKEDPSAAEEERRYLEVSRYQLLRQPSRKRPRDEGVGAAGGAYTEGIRTCGRALAVSLVASERRRHRGAEAQPPWVVVVLGDVGGSGPVHVYLEGHAAVQWHPFLRVGSYYDFPLLYEAGQSLPVPQGVLVCRAGRQGQAPVPPVQRSEEEARLLLGVFENGSHRPWTGRAPGPVPGPAPPPSSLVMSYEGKIRGVHRNSLYELEPLADGRRFYLLLAHDLPDLGAGMRPGATIRLDNAHPLCLWGELQAVGVCLYSQVRVLAFSDGDPVGSDQYRVPDSVQFSRYCLTLLEWSRRTRVSLRNKVLGCRFERQPPDWFEPSVVRPWSKRLGVQGHPDRSDKLSEVLLHDCGRCPVALGGLAMSDGRMSPPLPALPKLSEVRRAVGDLLSSSLARDGWVKLLRTKPASSSSASSSRWRHAFVLHDLRPPPAQDEEEGSAPAVSLPQPAVVLGWLSRTQHGRLLLEDVSGGMPLLLADGPQGTPPPWLSQLADAGSESGPRQLLGVKVEEEDLRVICELVRPSAASAGNALRMKLPLPGGGGDVVHAVPHLLTRSSSVLTVAPTTGEAESAGRAVQPMPEVQPLSRLLAAVDVARVRAKQPIECPASCSVRLVLVAVKEEGDRLHLYCRDSQGCDVMLLRLPATAQQQHLPLLPGCIVRLSGLTIQPDDTRGRKVALAPAGGGSFRLAVEGYRGVTAEDVRLAHLLHGNALAGAWPMEAMGEQGGREDLFYSMPTTPLSDLVPQDRLRCSLASVVATVMVFNKVQLVVRCSRCNSQHTRGSGLVCSNGSVLEPVKWEVQCVIDDGTAQATVFADAEVAVGLLGLQPSEQQRIENAALSQSPAELDSWLRVEVFGLAGGGARRLRRVRLAVREVLQGRGGKGGGGARPTLTFRRERGLPQPSSAPAADSAGGLNGITMWSFHMPTLKALQVVEVCTDAECRRQAHLLLHQA